MATISRYKPPAVQRFTARTAYGRGQTDKRGFKTKRDAEAFANTVEVTKARGEYVAPIAGQGDGGGVGHGVAGSANGGT